MQHSAHRGVTNLFRFSFMHLPDLNLKYLQKRAEAKKEDKGQLSKIECECRCKNSSAYLSLLEGKG